MFIIILVTNFFQSNPVFLDSNQNIQLRTSHHCRRRCFFSYHSTTWEIILFLGGTVCPLENVNLFGVLDPMEQPAKFKLFESKQTAMNSLLHEELRALASNLLRWCSYKTCNPTFFPRFVLVNFGVESAVENSQCTFHLPFCAGDR